MLSAPVGARTNWRILLVALGLGLLAAGLTLSYLRSLDGRGIVLEPPTIPVVVARGHLLPGKVITEDLVELKPIPEAAVLADGLRALDQVVGKTARYPVEPGEQVTSFRVVGPAKGQALSFEIPAGLRGFTIPVNVSKSPAALVAPGDFIDVLATMDPMELQLKQLAARGIAAPARTSVDSDSRFGSAVTVLQNVLVLSINRTYVQSGIPYDASVRGEPSKDSQVSDLTLAVTPEQAQQLALLVEKAKSLTVTLRAFGDADARDIVPFLEPDWTDLFNRRSSHD